MQFSSLQKFINTLTKRITYINVDVMGFEVFTVLIMVTVHYGMWCHVPCKLVHTVSAVSTMTIDKQVQLESLRIYGNLSARQTCSRNSHIQVSALKLIRSFLEQVTEFFEVFTVVWGLWFIGMGASGRQSFERMHCHSQEFFFLDFTIMNAPKSFFETPWRSATSQRTGICNSQTACGLSHYSHTDPP